MAIAAVCVFLRQKIAIASVFTSITLLCEQVGDQLECVLWDYFPLLHVRGRFVKPKSQDLFLVFNGNLNKTKPPPKQRKNIA